MGHWNKHAGFEQIRPNGNGCLGDMGFGSGHFTVYTRACKAPKGFKLSCKTVATGRSNYHAANCPGGYTMTGLVSRTTTGAGTPSLALRMWLSPTGTDASVTQDLALVTMPAMHDAASWHR